MWPHMRSLQTHCNLSCLCCVGTFLYPTFNCKIQPSSLQCPLTQLWCHITSCVIGYQDPDFIVHEGMIRTMSPKVPGAVISVMCFYSYAKIFGLPPSTGMWVGERQREGKRDWRREGGRGNIWGCSSLSSLTTPTGAFLSSPARLYLRSAAKSVRQRTKATPKSDKKTIWKETKPRGFQLIMD